jgi:hypothetical protein
LEQPEAADAILLSFFTSLELDVLSQYYLKKASKARNVANGTFAAMTTNIGSLLPPEGIRLYMAQVNRTAHSDS